MIVFSLTSWRQVVFGQGQYDQPLQVWEAIRAGFRVVEGHGRAKANFGFDNNIKSKRPKPPDSE